MEQGTTDTHYGLIIIRHTLRRHTSAATLLDIVDVNGHNLDPGNNNPGKTFFYLVLNFSTAVLNLVLEYMYTAVTRFFHGFFCPNKESIFVTQGGLRTSIWT